MPFMPLTKAFVADRDSGQVQAFVDKPERMSGLQSLLHVRPDGKTSSHQLRRLFPCEPARAGRFGAAAAAAESEAAG